MASARVIKSRSTTSCPIFECSFSMSAGLGASGDRPRRSNAEDMLSKAARLHVLIWVAWTPYFLANSDRVSSSRIASSATHALKSAEWFFRFFILDRLSHQSIHLNNWSKIPRPPLSDTLMEAVVKRDALFG
jgi:hypothetical protein